VLAEQLRRSSEIYKGKGPARIEIIVVRGISPKAAVVDTIGIGQKRTLGDVMFRDRVFHKEKEGTQKKMSNVLAGALRLVWLRMGGRIVSDAPHFPHSEALNFFDKHPKLSDGVQFAAATDLGGILSKPYAAGLLYLMAASGTDGEAYRQDPRPENINFDQWGMAETFFTLLSSGVDLKKGSPILALRDKLREASASGGSDRDMIVFWTILAWNAYREGREDFTKADFKLKMVEGKVSEPPYLGGLDVKIEEPEEVVEVLDDPIPVEVVSVKKPAKKGDAKEKKVATPKDPKAVKKAPATLPVTIKVGSKVHVKYVGDGDIEGGADGTVMEVLADGGYRIHLPEYEDSYIFDKTAKVTLLP
jgi:hypothetical protein